MSVPFRTQPVPETLRTVSVPPFRSRKVPAARMRSTVGATRTTAGFSVTVPTTRSVRFPVSVPVKSASAPVPSVTAERRAAPFCTVPAPASDAKAWSDPASSIVAPAATVTADVAGTTFTNTGTSGSATPHFAARWRSTSPRSSALNVRS